MALVLEPPGTACGPGKGTWRDTFATPLDGGIDMRLVRIRDAKPLDDDRVLLGPAFAGIHAR
jgi:hypothetical protein